MANIIKKELEKYNITSKKSKKLKIDENKLERLSCEFAQKRGYPKELGKISFRK